MSGLRYPLRIIMNETKPAGTVQIHTSWRWLVGFALLLVLPWAWIIFGWKGTVEEISLPPLETNAQSSYIVPSQKGPWGDLEVLRIVTEPPESCVVSYLSHTNISWVFAGYTPERLGALFDSAGLTPDQKRTFMDAARWDSSGGGCILEPGNDLVMALSPTSRAIIYGCLSLDLSNNLQNEPFRFRADLADEWLENSGLPSAVIDRVRNLTYHRGITILFSDLPLVLPMLETDVDRIKLLKVLSRQSTLLVSVRVTPETDIDALEAYWGKKEGRAKEIRPLLESLSKIPGGQKLDIVHLLPRFARKRLYVYASASGGDSGEAVYDCHWSTMNFWNDPPDNRFGDLNYVTQVIESEYEPVLDDFRFGDIILFMKSDTQAIHSAVYLADGILYTKNGPTQKSPWIMMKMETLTSYYETNVDLKIRGYRKKGW